MQATRTAHSVDLAGAGDPGFSITGTLREEREFETALPVIRTSPGAVPYVAKARAEPLRFALPPEDRAYLWTAAAKRWACTTGPLHQ